LEPSPYGIVKFIPLGHRVVTKDQE